MIIIIYNFLIFLIFILTFPGSYFILFYYFKNSNFNLPKKKYFYWIHCASLGEVKIALRLIDEIYYRTKISKEKILLTITNPRIKEIVFRNHKETYIFPFDFYFFTRSFIKIVRPKVLLVLETELWPNYIYLSKKFGMKIFLLNGRMSKKTLVFLRMFKIFFKPICDIIDYFCVREEIDFVRFSKICSKDKIIVTGNMKYDDIEDFSLEISKKDLGFSEDDFVLTFGSMRDGEEDFVLEAIKKLAPDKIKFIVAPRHLKNVSKYEKLLLENKIKFIKRTELEIRKENNFDCILVDTLGELKKFYFVSDIVFVGGSILPYGGQSIIEPASLGKVVIFGPYTSNFFEISKLLKINKAGYSIRSAKEFVELVLLLKKDKALLRAIGENARNVIYRLKGATGRNVKFVLERI